VKGESLNRIVPLGERHLLKTLRAFAANAITSGTTKGSRTS